MPNEPKHDPKRRARNRLFIFNSAAVMVVAATVALGSDLERGGHHVLYGVLLMAAGALALTSGIVTVRYAYRSRRAD